MHLRTIPTLTLRLFLTLLLLTAVQATVLPAHYNTRIHDTPSSGSGDLVNNDSHVFGADMFYEADVPVYHGHKGRDLIPDSEPGPTALPTSSKGQSGGRRPRRRPGRAHP